MQPQRFASVRAVATLATLILSFVCGPEPLVAATFLVGAGGAPCTHATIGAALAAAIGSAGADEIRIARNQAYTNVSLHLTDWSPATVGAITLAGGYDNCADVTASEETTLDGAANPDPVIEVDTASQAASIVTLRNLVLTGSSVQGLRVEAGGIVTAENVHLSENATGGAIVSQGGQLTLDRFCEVLSNTGPGLACNTAAQIDSNGALIFLNTAAAGGGVLAASGCALNLWTGTQVAGNDAVLGGGIHASSGATVVLDGTLAGNLDTAVGANSADEQGGGIYATGAATVTVRNAWVDFNTAGLEGGGLWAADGAKIIVDRVTGSCFPSRCSSVSYNQVTQSNSTVPGAAAWAESGADIEIYQTLIDGNMISPTADFGSILYATGAGSTITVEGVQLHDNQNADAMFEADSGAHLSLAFVTSSANVYNGQPTTSPVVLTGAATATLNTSIFHPNLPVVVGVDSTITEADCLIVSDTTGLPGDASFISTDDPQLSLRNEILRPALNSPAIDFCDTFVYAPVHSDGDHEPRGIDLASSPNGSPGPGDGIYDLGFDEVVPVFVDGFESGDTTAWSVTVP